MEIHIVLGILLFYPFGLYTDLSAVFGIEMQSDILNDESIQYSTEEETFSCEAISDKKPNIVCLFNIKYNILDFVPECTKSYKESVMAVSLSRRVGFSRRPNMFANTLVCLSNSPMEVQADFNDHNEKAALTEIRQQRILEKHSHKSTYKYKLTFLLTKAELLLHFKHATLVKFTISNANNREIETKVLLEFVPTDATTHESGEICTERTYLLQGRSFIEVTNTTITIPFVSIVDDTFTLEKSVCPGHEDVNGVCHSDKPSAFCLGNVGQRIKIEKGSIITPLGSHPFISLSSLLDVLNITDKRLKITPSRHDPVPYSEWENVAAFSKNKDERLIVVNNENFSYSELNSSSFKQQLDWEISSECIRQDPLPYSHLKYLLHSLRITERLIGEAPYIWFDPLEGFHINATIFLTYGPGWYSFIRSEKCQFVSAQRVFVHLPDFHRTPKGLNNYVATKNYSLFNGVSHQTEITLTCDGANKNITMDGDKSDIIYYHEVWKDSYTRFYAKATFPISKLKMQSGLRYGCVDDFCPSGRANLVPWNMFAQDGDEFPLRFSRDHKMFYCSTAVAITDEALSLTLRQWRCKNRFQCQIVASSCLSDHAIEKKEISIFGEERNCMESILDVNTESCDDFRNSEMGTYCEALRPVNKGIVQCLKIINIYNEEHKLCHKRTSHQLITNFNVYYGFFEGFDEKYYVEHEMEEEPPLNAILKLHGLTSDDYYTNATYKFRCEAHSFFYEDGIQWFLKFSNGSVLSPSYDDSDIKSNQTTNFNPVSILTLRLLDTNLENVVCSAPKIGTELWSNATLKITVLDSLPAKISNTEFSILLNKNAKGQTIPCQTKGHPRPTVKWYRFNKEIQLPLRILDGDTLLIPDSNSSFYGKYVCKAENVAGNDTATFFVSEKAEETFPSAVGAVGLLIIAFLALLSVALFLAYLRSDRIKRYRQLKEIIHLLNGKVRGHRESQSDELLDPIHLPFNESYDIQKTSFVIDREHLLGSGEFSEVYKGQLSGVDGPVAFKMVRQYSPMLHLKALVSELKILMYVGQHENLVVLLGAYKGEIKYGKLIIAMEFCDWGSLKSYLRSYKHLFLKCPVLNPSCNSKESLYGNCEPVGNNSTPFSLHSINSLFKWAGQIANGMDYLGTRNVIHSDLAARNVLLTAEGNAKVTDFGLSRRMYHYSEYIKKGKEPLPWKWLAVECIVSKTFSTRSDVWAYGITLWEMFSLGEVPYPGVEPSLQFVQQLENGMRNCKPKHASTEIYLLMIHCWQLDPNKRPKFSSLKRIFDNALTKNKIGIDVSLEEDDLAVECGPTKFEDVYEVDCE